MSGMFRRPKIEKPVAQPDPRDTDARAATEMARRMGRRGRSSTVLGRLMQTAGGNEQMRTTVGGS